MKTKIFSWGKTSSKEVELINNLNNTLTVLTYGNNNSYGDCSIPLGEFGLDPKFSEENNGFINPKITISNLINLNKSLFYGIPGRRSVTIGGALASDVHGKDSFWGGSFINNIEKLKVLLPNNEIIECTRNKNPEVFYTTIGGYGLTGTIASVKIKENTLGYSNNFTTKIYKGIGIESLLNRFSNNLNEYSVAWVDLINKNFPWVYEISKRNNSLQNEFTQLPTEDTELSVSFPFIGTNKFKSMQVINKKFYNYQKDNYQKDKSLNEVLYPLGLLTDSRTMAKKRKIVQVQFSIPLRYESSIDKLLELLTKDQFPIICSIKKTGKKETNLNLSFLQEGWTVAVDFPAENFNFKSIRNFYKLLISYDGKVYLAKDSTLNEEEFKLMYNNYPEWKKVVKKIDPENKYQSELSNRLGLKSW